MINEVRQEVEECYDELCFIIVSVTELTFRFETLLCRDERDWLESLEKTFTLFFLYSILKVVFIEEEVRYLGDIWMTSILGS